MNWGNLDSICKEHELVLIDTSSLRFYVPLEEAGKYSYNQLKYLQIEYARFMRNILENNKNLKTIPGVIKEISSGLGNFGGRNVKIYRDVCKNLFKILKNRHVKEPEKYEDSIKIVKNVKDSYNLSDTDCDLIAFLIASDKKVAGLSNDFLLSYVAFDIGKQINVNDFNLYHFNGVEFLKTDDDYLINIRHKF